MNVPSVHRIDTQLLTRPIDQGALDAFIAESKAAGKPWSRMTTGLTQPGVSELIAGLLPAVIPLVGLSAIAMAGGRSLATAIIEFTFEAPFPLNLVIVGVLALMLLGVGGAVLRVVSLIRRMAIPRWWWEAAYRITGFAQANRLDYGHDEAPSHPGVIFQAGGQRTIERRLTSTSGRRVEIGNYRYTVSGDSREADRVYGWGYVAITLDRRLPHLLLDAKANNSSVFGIRTSNLPVDLSPDQKLSLGGEFDDKFTLYAPSDYGRDAFQIFAPDLMALFIDRLGTFDVEIIDDTLFVYGGRFDLFSPTTYDWLREVVDTVVARTVRRTGRYTDDFATWEAIGSTDSRPAIDPAAGSTGAPAAGFSLLPGFAVGGTPLTGQPAGPPAPTPAAEPVFAIGGDGPPQLATNRISERGRRLRRRRWGAWSVVTLLFVLFWLYNDIIGPMFGLPTLDN